MGFNTVRLLGRYMLGDVEVRSVSFACYFGKHAVSLNCVNMWKLLKSVFLWDGGVWSRVWSRVRSRVWEITR